MTFTGSPDFGRIPTLATLPPDDRAALAPFSRVDDYARDDTIFFEGDPSDRIHFIVSGRVKIVKAAGTRDLILEILGPGEPVGAVAAYEDRPFPATAVALEPSEVLSIPKPDFFRLLESRPEMARRLLAALTLRLMTLNKRLADMTGTVEFRAARLFLALKERLGQQRDDGVFIPLPLARQEIADLLGATIETTIRLMSRWQKEGVIVTDKQGFLLPNPERLESLAAEE